MKQVKIDPSPIMETLTNNSKYAFGITSKTQDKQHIYMADIDENIPYENLEDIAREIVKKFRLNHLWIIKSSNGYNLYSLDKMSLKLIYIINNQYPSFDQQYNNLQRYKRGFYTLRIGKDKKVIDCIHNWHTPIHIMSNAHRIFFNLVFNLNVKQDKSFDDYQVFKIIKFYNEKHGVNIDG